ncbi:unnamed protein product [Staurois parvus]|uniref:Uncharacterized protein n=1 Tax=Staurois parvus TaxID=386267 RepID=A0ABN9C8Q1_9NEOB|nr:unnamed protein product [Staurois parvus]
MALGRKELTSGAIKGLTVCWECLHFWVVSVCFTGCTPLWMAVLCKQYKAACPC